MTAPSGDKDLGGGDRTVDEMTCIANTSVSGASVVAGDGARADTLHSCKPDIVEPGSGASPPSPTNVLLPQSAGVSEPESTSEGAVEGAGITTAQVCACAPSQSSEGDSVPSSDKTGEKKAPVDNGDNGEQSSGNVPTNLWKRMKDAGLIQ